MKLYNVIMFIFLLIVTLTACDRTGGPAAGPDNRDNKISVICTVFPQYDWTRQLIGDRDGNIELTLLLSNGVDMHSYQPTVEDIVKISTCDLFIYVGGQSDKWVENALSKAINPDMVVINLIESLGGRAKTEELTEGMEDDHEDEHEEGAAYDEHVWLSLKNAELFCSVIADKLSSIDPAGAAEYKNNLAAYLEKLSTLDKEYEAVVNAAPNKILLFGDRFPFRYLMDDYGLKYYAAFPGCSAETEASFETVAYLSKKTEELNLGAVIVTESSDKSIAEAIVNNTTEKSCETLVMDSMQSVRLSDIQNGITYLSIMEGNLNTLKKALGL